MLGQRNHSPSITVSLGLAISLTARKFDVYVPQVEIEEQFGQPGFQRFSDCNDFFRQKGVDIGLAKIRPEEFLTRSYMFPCTIPLKNGDALIALSAREAENGDVTLSVLDPLDAEGKRQAMPIAQLQEDWMGSVVVAKERRGSGAKEREFKLNWFLPEIWRNKNLFLMALVLSLILNALAFAPIIFIQIALDKVVGYQATTTLYVLTGGVVLALVFNAVLGYVRDYLFNFVGDRLESRIVGDVFDKLLDLPMQSVQATGSAALERSIRGVVSLRKLIVSKVFAGTLDLTSVVIFLPILFFYSSYLGLMVLGFAILMGVASVMMKSYERRNNSTLVELDQDRNAVLRETVNGLSLVKSLSLEDNQRSSWRRMSAASIKGRAQQESIASTSSQINNFLQQLMTVAIIFVGVHLVFAGELTAGSLIAVNMVAARMVRPVVKAFQIYAEKDQIIGLIAQIGSLWNAAPERSGAGVRKTIMGSYHLKDVSVTFPDGAVALDGITVNIPEHSRVAIVGPSGAGKSTLLKLLDGVFPPGAGMLDVDGIRIGQYDLPHYRSQVALVTAQSGFFKGTIEENIRRVCPNYGQRELEELMSLVGLDEHLQRLPDGLATEIDDSCSQLPSAQRQKLALIRVLLSAPRVLLLDEAVNAFGKRDLLRLKRNLREIAHGHTFIFVSQELAMVADFDRILVLEEGKVVGFDTHAQLLQSCPRYAKMWHDEQQLFTIERAAE